MPETYPKVRYHPSKPPYRLCDAAKSGQLVVVTCALCKRCVHYLAADLVEIGLGDRPALVPFWPCSRCRTAEFVSVKVRLPAPGDLGVLKVRRPARLQVVKWRTVAL